MLARPIDMSFVDYKKSRKDINNITKQYLKGRYIHVSKKLILFTNPITKFTSYKLSNEKGKTYNIGSNESKRLKRILK